MSHLVDLIHLRYLHSVFLKVRQGQQAPLVQLDQQARQGEMVMMVLLVLPDQQALLDLRVLKALRVMMVQMVALVQQDLPEQPQVLEHRQSLVDL